VSQFLLRFSCLDNMSNYLDNQTERTIFLIDKLESGKEYLEYEKQNYDNLTKHYEDMQGSITDLYEAKNNIRKLKKVIDKVKSICVKAENECINLIKGKIKNVVSFRSHHGNVGVFCDLTKERTYKKNTENDECEKTIDYAKQVEELKKQAILKEKLTFMYNAYFLSQGVDSKNLLDVEDILNNKDLTLEELQGICDRYCKMLGIEPMNKYRVSLGLEHYEEQIADGTLTSTQTQTNISFLQEGLIVVSDTLTQTLLPSYLNTATNEFGLDDVLTVDVALDTGTLQSSHSVVRNGITNIEKLKTDPYNVRVNNMWMTEVGFDFQNTALGKLNTEFANKMGDFEIRDGFSYIDGETYVSGKPKVGSFDTLDVTCIFIANTVEIAQVKDKYYDVLHSTTSTTDEKAAANCAQYFEAIETTGKNIGVAYFNHMGQAYVNNAIGAALAPENATLLGLKSVNTAGVAGVDTIASGVAGMAGGTVVAVVFDSAINGSAAGFAQREFGSDNNITNFRDLSGECAASAVEQHRIDRVDAEMDAQMRLNQATIDKANADLIAQGLPPLDFKLDYEYDQKVTTTSMATFGENVLENMKPTNFVPNWGHTVADGWNYFEQNMESVGSGIYNLKQKTDGFLDYLLNK